MTRCIAILTLALTAALSADQAFALDPGNCVSALRATYEPDQMLVVLGVQIDDEGGGADYYQPGEFEISPGNCTSALRDADDLELLVAFVAYEYGTEAACEMLLELGISPGDCVSALRTGVSIVDSGGLTD